MQAAALAERDQLLGDRPQLLRLRQRRGDLLVLQQRVRHVAEHGEAVAGGDAELPAGNSVTHRILSGAQNGSSSRLARSSMFSGGQPDTVMPSDRPMEASTSLISFSDLRPKFGVRSISCSVFCTRSPM